MLEVVVGHQEYLELTVRHGESDERQITEVPALLLGGQLREERAVIVGKLQVAQVNALKRRQERHGRRGGAADLDDAGGLCLCGLGRFLLRGPHLTQWRISLGQVVGAGVADTDFSLEENGEFVGQLRGGRAGNDFVEPAGTVATRSSATATLRPSSCGEEGNHSS